MCRYAVWSQLEAIYPKKNFCMTERSTEESKYKNGHISDITYYIYGTRLRVAPMDRYLFGASPEIILNKVGTTE